MLWVVEYAVVPERAGDLTTVWPRHRAVLDGFRAEGQVVLVGPFDDRTGSMAVFRTKEAAEAFVAADPFVVEGLAIPAPARAWDA